MPSTNIQNISNIRVPLIISNKVVVESLNFIISAEIVIKAIMIIGIIRGKIFFFFFQK